MQYLGDFLMQSEPGSMFASRASVDYSASESSADSDDNSVSLSQQKWWNGRAVWPVSHGVFLVVGCCGLSNRTAILFLLSVDFPYVGTSLLALYILRP